MVIHVYMSMTNGGWKDQRDMFYNELNKNKLSKQ